jgi:hypothetical protein
MQWEQSATRFITSPTDDAPAPPPLSFFSITNARSRVVWNLRFAGKCCVGYYRSSSAGYTRPRQCKILESSVTNSYIGGQQFLSKLYITVNTHVSWLQITATSALHRLGSSLVSISWPCSNCRFPFSLYWNERFWSPTVHSAKVA